MASSSADAASIVNGALDQVADYNIHNSVVPLGWTADPASTDVFDSTTTFSNYAWLPSAGGGTFVHALAFSTYQEGFSQVVSGLTRENPA